MLSRIKSDDRIHGTGDSPALRETRRAVNRSIRAFLFCQPFGQNAGGLSSFDQPLIGRRIAQHESAKPLLPFEQAQEAFDAGEIESATRCRTRSIRPDQSRSSCARSSSARSSSWAASAAICG